MSVLLLALTYVVQAFRPAATRTGRTEALHYENGGWAAEALSETNESSCAAKLNPRLAIRRKRLRFITDVLSLR